MNTAPHISVLLNEVVAAVSPQNGGCILDGTFGAGGYSRAFLDAADCKVWGIDRDPRAIAIGKALESECPGRFTVLKGRFSQMRELAQEAGLAAVDGIALDIGVSSMQLDEAERGFSFSKDGPLDMRMEGEGENAADVVNAYDEAEIADILYHYGEETKSRRIAKEIVRARQDKPITRTLELAEIVRRAVGGKPTGVHPATKTFQALRIHVNRELSELEDGLVAAEALLAPQGRLAVVTFHSLEDRIVKRFFEARSGRGARVNPSRHLPLPEKDMRAPSFFQPSHKATTPGKEELERNPRARSAKLRWAVRTDAPAWPQEEAA